MMFEKSYITRIIMSDISLDVKENQMEHQVTVLVGIDLIQIQKLII